MAQTEGDDLTIAERTGPRVGDLFAERYEIERLLGRGGMGLVFRVRDREVGELVALKLLDGLRSTPEAVERFRREVRLARRVTHRNAARTYDLGEHQSWRFLTMEYVDGESLREHIGRARPSPARALSFAFQIAEGLAAAHEAGVVHRDLKPGNVLIERSGRVVLTDFGIARALAGSDATMQTGGLLGTPAYMAPEQIAGDRVEAPADLYSLGLILFEMLTGRLPFGGNSPMAIALARLHQPLPDLNAEPGIPAALVPILERCLARDVESRIQSATELASKIGSVAGEIGTDDESLAMSFGPSTSAATLAMSAVATRPRGTTTPAPSHRALAVLPFRFRGPADESYIAESLSDELIDVLSTMRGMRVSGSGATARFADASDRDPRTIGAELGVDAIVDGTVQLSGKRVRISARLLDVASGFQLWTERYDGALEDVFELQDTMGRRIAEALRLELEHIAHRGEAPADAIEAYLRARQLARIWEWKGPSGAIAHYERCLVQAPEFKPALAGLAIACLRAWFRPAFDPDEPDWEAMAERAVAAAIAGAPELAETHLAAATHAVQYGRYVEAAESLRQALRIAPTYAAAHEYLGRLQIEAGRSEQGIAHLELALELDAGLTMALADIARHKALHGDLAAFDQLIARARAGHGRAVDLPTTMIELRVGTWTRDEARLADAVARLPPHIPDSYALSAFAQDMRHGGPAGMSERVKRVLAAARNPRFASLVHQVAAESAMFHGLEDQAMAHIQAAADSVLVDLDWIEHCPLFSPLRQHPQFQAIRALVRSRAEAIWTTPSVGAKR